MVVRVAAVEVVDCTINLVLGEVDAFMVDKLVVVGVAAVEAVGIKIGVVIIAQLRLRKIPGKFPRAKGIIMIFPRVLFLS